MLPNIVDFERNTKYVKKCLSVFQVFCLLFHHQLIEPCIYLKEFPCLNPHLPPGSLLSYLEITCFLCIVELFCSIFAWQFFF